MPETHPCTKCDKVLTKAYELKKHMATHDDPNSVFHCPRCDFITLQKKNLGIHFKIHTGEKDLECPHTIDSEQRCDYKTHDPAALSKHRQKIHGYIPPPNRSRPKKVTFAAPCKTAPKRAEKSPRRRRRTQPITISPRRKQIRSPRKVQKPNGDSGDGTTPAPFLLLDNVDVDPLDEECFGVDTDATLIGTDDDMGLDTLYDASLRSQWMATFEMSYSAFDMAGMQQQLESLPEDCPFDPTGHDEPEDRGSLCAEWMRELRLEGWDSSAVQTYEENYAIGA